MSEPLDRDAPPVVDSPEMRVQPLGDVPGGWWKQAYELSSSIIEAQRKAAKRRPHSVVDKHDWKI